METAGTSELSIGFDQAKAEMDLFEAALQELTPPQLLYQLEDLTTIIYAGNARLGDFERQMRVKRVILRRLVRLNNLYAEGEKIMERIEKAQQLDLLSGTQRKEKALADHEDHKGAAIRWLRSQMISLYRERVFGYAPKLGGTEIASVNADDARRIYEASSFPAEYSKNRTFFGSIFRGQEWSITGERVRSTHPANNARKIECWRYLG